jgi:hypothetical protein
MRMNLMDSNAFERQSSNITMRVTIMFIGFILPIVLIDFICTR